MSRSWKITQWVALGLVVLLGIAWEFFPLPDASDRLQRLPLQGAGFKGQELPVSDTEKAVFKDNRIVKRIYQVSRQRFFLSIVDGTHHRSAVHDPTLCFQGDGWSIAGRREISLVGGTGQVLTLARGEERQEILLWFSNGKRRYSSLVRYWLDTTLRRLTLGRSGPEPVRVIVQPLDSHPLDWNKLLRDFYPLWEI